MTAIELAIILAGLASLAVLFQVFLKHIDGRPLIAYEPRRSVPWNFVAPLVILSPTLLVLANAFLGGGAYEPTGVDVALAIDYGAPLAGQTPAAWLSGHVAAAAGYEVCRLASEAETIVTRTWSQAAALIFLALSCLALLVAVFKATPRDLGLPRSSGQLKGDVVLGAIALMTALLPVYAIQTLLTIAFEPEQIHPLIQQLKTMHSPGMMIASAVAAVIAAPLFEETAFRLVFQGWLERREDAALGLPTSWAHDLHQPGDAADALDGALSLPPIYPPRSGVISALPHGWTPILTSAALFSLAHLGHGVAPISLFLLGVVLGYLYQRTHRIVPCIACHMLFNGFSLTMLWLDLRAG